MYEYSSVILGFRLLKTPLPATGLTFACADVPTCPKDRDRERFFKEKADDMACHLLNDMAGLPSETG